MRVVKKINNNVAVCIDDRNNELIAFGKGIGFPKTPYELNDMSTVYRTYYHVNPKYYDLIKEISSDIIEISSKIVDEAMLTINKELNPNIAFTLADHINFAIQRYESHMDVKIPISYDIQYLYEDEMKLGKKAVRYINQAKNIKLPLDEAAGIALHFINAEKTAKEINTNSYEQTIQDITQIIEESFTMHIDKNNFNYSRFVSHMVYLLKRDEKDETLNSQNQILFNSIKSNFQRTYECSLKIKDYLLNKKNLNLNQEELLYLMLHINRLCTREDCNL